MAREAKSKTTVEGWLGEDDFPSLLNLTNSRNEIDLLAACPVYGAMAAAPKALKMARLQSAIDKVLSDRGMEHLVVIVTPAIFTIFVSMKWHRLTPDSLTSGFLGNPFLFGACDEEATNALNLRAQFIHGGDTAASDSDTQALLKIVVNPPMEDESIDNIKRMEVVASILLPPGHVFLIHLRDHIQGFNQYEQNWRTLPMTNATLQGAKGAYHLQFEALRFSKYWKSQKRSAVRVSLEDPDELINLIDMGKQWEPSISHSLATSLKLSTLGRLSKVQPPAGLNDDAKTLATQLTNRSLLTGLTIDTPDTAARTDASTVGTNKGKENAAFHHVLFGAIKTRTVGGKTVKSRDVREKIRKGELPQLPPSKADGAPMCLAWHTKGICNPECPRAADHAVIYSAEEYQPLIGWCDLNYPKDE